MKNLKEKLKKALIVLFVASVFLAGCKTEEVIPQQEKLNLKPNSKSNIGEFGDPESPEITTLKNYMATTLNVDVNSITYDAGTEQFILFGVNQINKTDLSSSYSESLY